MRAALARLLWRGVRGSRGVSSVAAPPRAAYAVLENVDMTVFEKLLGANAVCTDDLDPYNTDFLHAYKGASKCVLFPSTSEEVSAVLRHCYARRLAVVPQSGNTSLVGGSVPVYDEVVLSLRKFNKHLDFDPMTGVLECDAGFIMEEVDNRLARDGFMMPYDLGSRGSCLIGGNVATGVGGLRRLRFGSIHNHLLGVTAVLPDEKGTVTKFGAKVRKDNTGLHMHHLFIGGEGQLGIVTNVIMCVVPRPSSVQVAMLGVKTYRECLEVLRVAKKSLGEILSAFELMDAECMRCLLENESLPNVLTSNPPFNLIIETMGSSDAHDKEKVESFINEVLDKGLAVDGTQAASKQEANRIWKLRRTIPVAPLKDGYVYKHDISLPMEHFYTLSKLVRERVSGDATRVLTFGHMADGDSHINVSCKQYSPKITAALYPFMCEWIAENGGSISAEHGVGQERRPYASLGKGHAVEIAKRLKRDFDPRCILSPYKMIEAQPV